MLEWVLIVTLYYSRYPVTVDMKTEQACVAAALAYSKASNQVTTVCINRETGQLIKQR